MSAGFSLGGIIFDQWETPELMPFPAGHKANLLINIGGQRQVDMMGPEPAEIQWVGRSRGQNAAQRMAALRAMCIAGAQVPLIWDQFYLTVVIIKFTPVEMRSWEWTYGITCLIVDDSTADSTGNISSSLDTLVQSDMNTALGLIS